MKKLNYEALYNYLQDNNILNENQLIELKEHRNTTDFTFWGHKEGKENYTLTILKDNGNIFEDVEIFVTTTSAAKEELKEVFYNKDINYKQYKENLYVNRAWIGKDEKECLCLVLNDKISIYIDENIEPICGDIITGEWLDLDLEECCNLLNDMLGKI